jgi:hypothetical protein
MSLKAHDRRMTIGSYGWEGRGSRPLATLVLGAGLTIVNFEQSDAWRGEDRRRHSWWIVRATGHDGPRGGQDG